MELAVTVAIFGILLLILVSLEGQYLRFDRSVRVEFLKHPETEAVLARVRRDVLDSTTYPLSFRTFSQSPRTLIVAQSDPSGHLLTVVYQFGDSDVKRTEFRDDVELSTWIARGVPAYEVTNFEMPDGVSAVRLMAHDAGGRAVVDQIVTPRVHS